MRRHDEALPPGHEDAGRLVALHAAVQHVDGVRQAGQVSQALGGVEGQQLRVLQGEGHGQAWRWRQLLGERSQLAERKRFMAVKRAASS